jgi:uncharacterized RDD family membrane protein YckC
MGNNNEYDPYAKHDSADVTEPFIPVYAGFWIRFIAYIIDGFVLGIASMIIMIPLFIVMILTLPMDSSSRYGSDSGFGTTFCCIYCLTIIVSLVGQWLYFAWFESSKYMGTPGKILLGLAVTDENGERISFRKATLRYVSKLFTNVFFGIGYIVIAFSSKKQGLYDLIAHTLVIKK